MATIKTAETDDDVAAHIAAIDDDTRRADCRALADLMQRVTGAAPKLWSNGTIGFGRYHYRTGGGSEGDWFLVGLANRKQAISIHLSPWFDGFEALRDRLGKCTHGRGCIYVKRLADIDTAILEDILVQSVADMRQRFPDAE